jgi:WhiB family redox-sensing transcriptional regulator
MKEHHLRTDGSNLDPATIVVEASMECGVVSALLVNCLGALPEWCARAACIGHPLEMFFPTRGESNQPAFQVCGRCEVRVDCLNEALGDPDLDHGVRGGLSANARGNARKLRDAAGGRRGAGPIPASADVGRRPCRQEDIPPLTEMGGPDAA